MLASEEEVLRSALVQTFSSVPDTVDLPFTKQQARAWITQQGDGKITTKHGVRIMNFVECTDALKVRRSGVVVRCCEHCCRPRRVALERHSMPPTYC